MEYMLCCNLKKIRVLVVGFGTIGRRKVQTLLEAGAEDILVLDIQEIEDIPRGVYFEQRICTIEDIDSASLVYITTSNRDVNKTLAEHCMQKKTLCFVADAPEEGTCSSPATYSCNEYLIGVSTKGKSPSLAKKICEQFAGILTEDYIYCARYIACIREHLVREGISVQKRASLISSILEEEDCHISPYTTQEELYTKHHTFFIGEETLFCTILNSFYSKS